MRAVRWKHAIWPAPSKRRRVATSIASSINGPTIRDIPRLECTWQWDADKRVGSLRVEQKQEGDKVYDLRTVVRFEIGGPGAR